VAGAAGGIAGLLVGLVIGDCNILDGCSSDVLALTPVVLGLWSASAFTVYGTGRLLDGRGGLLPTLLGGALGSGAGILIGSASDALYLTPLIAALGAVIGFEFSHAGTKPEPKKDPFAAAGLQLTPVVSMLPAGGVFGGLVGRF
jgi:hypothetical protein